MPRALIDTSVLFAAAYRRDGAHGDALPIFRGTDAADLPEAVIIDHVLAETLNGLTTHAGHEAAVDLLGRVEENAQHHVDSLTADAFATAKGLFRRHEGFSLVDACLVAYIRAEGIGYCYAFDDDLDAAEGVSRLDVATNPYQPE